MKISLNGILVVEGKEDAAYLSNYIQTEIVVMNGFELNKSTILYLKEKHVIALLDPDEAGKQIRQTLNKELTNVSNVEIDIKRCTRGIKNGIAECEIDEILNQLKPYMIENKENISNIKQSDLYALGLITNKEKRAYVCQKLNLGICNGKTLLKRLTLNNVGLKQLCEIIEEYNNGN